MSYVPTVGVQNVIFSVENRVFQLFDIGGQRIDRRKWATMYDGIDAILFCIAVSEYNQTMVEDPEANRLQDSLSLLEKISNEPKFKNTPLLLFLNEIDVFREKLPLMPLEDSLPEYKGKSAEDGLDFIEGLAKKAMEGRDESLRRIYRTCAIDTESMSKILEDVFRTVLKVV
ncbi:g-protein alpha subunit [Ancylostoma caninum]|uniref:G-protein alpha subunit n=1 Tax=Ancylostoma caninum TaxID=29170 RepID=A0A368G6J7_ANCCA|nr:g-protein alpha subunit [Ancylostoma caninum]